ncbi:MAG: hypothetical protein NXH75_12635, partial [Halobacteriovoraceae bacterium]|nr:hypothetical protein [Halobacteriovoraceae bacterium]
IQIFAGDAVDCARTKRHMDTLCGDYMVDECKLIPDCLKRRDSCGAGGPLNANECSRYHKCNQALYQQYPHQFSEPSGCYYEWTEVADDKSKSWCRVKSKLALTESACPGNRSLFNLLVTSVDSSVDSEYNCAHLQSRYQAKKKRCDKIRAEFKVNCMVDNSDEDMKAYMEASYPACRYYQNFKDYFSKRTMVLDVRMKDVHNGTRKGKPTDFNRVPDESEKRGEARRR